MPGSVIQRNAAILFRALSSFLGKVGAPAKLRQGGTYRLGRPSYVPTLVRPAMTIVSSHYAVFRALIPKFQIVRLHALVLVVPHELCRDEWLVGNAANPR